MTSVCGSMALHTGGLGERNSTSTNTVSPLIVKQSDRRCEFSYKISEKDFKNLHPNDFEDLFLLNIQEKLNHLPKTDKTSLHTAVNMWIRNLVAVSSSLRLLEPKRTIESRAKRSSINLVRTQHPSETMVFHNEDGNPARANIKQALGRPHKGVKASANSDVMYFFTSAQDGDPLQDDVRLCLGDDLKKAQDHSQRQV
ncbi:hypothetical protein Tco_0709392 [Tanacetum coccineum]